MWVPPPFNHGQVVTLGQPLRSVGQSFGDATPGEGGPSVLKAGSVDSEKGRCRKVIDEFFTALANRNVAQRGDGLGKGNTLGPHGSIVKRSEAQGVGKSEIDSMKFVQGSIALALLMPVVAPAAPWGLYAIEIRRNTVVEVIADQDLNVKKVREGDRFSATVANDYELPKGSRLLGEVVRVEPKRGDEKAYMDLEFRNVELPDGSRQRIAAIPIALNNKAIGRDRDGRMYADAKKVRNEYYVLGGLVGGLVLGSILKKPFEGAFIGTLAGIIFGEAERQKEKNSSDLVLKKGTKLGAVVLEDTTLEFDDRNWRNDRYRDRDRDRDDRDRDRDRDRGDYSRYDIRYQDRSLRFDSSEAPYANGRVTMVPAKETARQLGLAYDRVGERVYIENDSDSVRLSVGDTSFRNGGRRLELGAPVEDRNGVVYVPIEAFASLVRQPLFVNGQEVRKPYN